MSKKKISYKNICNEIGNINNNNVFISYTTIKLDDYKILTEEQLIELEISEIGV